MSDPTYPAALLFLTLSSDFLPPLTKMESAAFRTSRLGRLLYGAALYVAITLATLVVPSVWLLKRTG